jgi:hypothetical protein
MKQNSNWTSSHILGERRLLADVELFAVPVALEVRFQEQINLSVCLEVSKFFSAFFSPVVTMRSFS